MKLATAALGGIGIAALAQFVALIVADAGHGWTEPYTITPVMWILAPLMSVRMQQAALARQRWLDGLILSHSRLSATCGWFLRQSKTASNISKGRCPLPRRSS